ncbi:MAG: dodecin family protein [Chloroflexota bacterium]|nr:dodecin family protein [Chloroflexota bacterium]
MPVVKVIELVSSSESSFDDAVQSGLAEATRTLRGVSGIEITNWTVDVENNNITRYKVTMKVAFRVREGEGGGL